MVHVLYHDNCYDGFACAFIARFVRPDCILHPVLYSDPIPEIPDMQEVWILDFSYKRDVLKKLADRSSSVIVLDHHLTAQEELQTISHPKLHITFDMNESGAILTWKHFVNPTPPQFIEYIKDRDLWLFKLPKSKEFSAWLQSYPRELNLWNELRLKPIPEALEAGTHILRFMDQKVEEICTNAIIKDFDGYQVPVVNASCFFSEVGNRLCQLHPDSPFAAYYFDRKDGIRQWGLRSLGFDVSQIAKNRGGGGHKQAAGFEEKL